MSLLQTSNIKNLQVPHYSQLVLQVTERGQNLESQYNFRGTALPEINGKSWSCDFFLIVRFLSSFANFSQQAIFPVSIAY